VASGSAAGSSLLPALGAVIWAVAAFFSYIGQVDSFQRLTVPGTATVHVSPERVDHRTHRDLQGSLDRWPADGRTC